MCSHGHYDHGGGYREFVKNGLSCPLATGKGFFSEKYSLGKTKAACLGTGFDAAFLKENKIRHMECDGLVPLAQGCWVMGGIGRRRAFETIPKRFVLDVYKRQDLCAAAGTGVQHGLAVIRLQCV